MDRANGNASPATQPREHAVRCFCGVETWDDSGLCDFHLRGEAIEHLVNLGFPYADAVDIISRLNDGPVL